MWETKHILKDGWTFDEETDELLSPEGETSQIRDATVLSWVTSCPRKFQYAKEVGLETFQKNRYLLAGIAMHEGFDVYYAVGDADLAKQAIIEKWDDGDELPYNKKTAHLTLSQLLGVFDNYLEHYSFDQFEPIRAKESDLNLEDVIAAKIRVMPDGTVILGESSFVMRFEVDEAEILLAGKPDLPVVNSVGNTYVMDHKAQPLNSKVLCPSGWKRVGDLVVGDLVADRSGEFVKVKNLFPKGKTAVYRITFNDRTSVLCGEDHLWLVGTQYSDSWKVISAKGLINKAPSTKFHIPLTEPIQHPEKALPLDPYLLGVLLGDGYLAGSSVVLSTSKDWLVDKVRDRLPQDSEIVKSNSDNLSWVIRGRNGVRGNSVLTTLELLNLRGTKAPTKFIPQIYLFGSIKQRRNLLQGLLDTDGLKDGPNQMFDSTSLALVEGTCELVRSLGGQARYREMGGTNYTRYRANLRLPEWGTGVGKRYIVSLERVESEETICIEVDSLEGLYITDNHTVTHNTTSSYLSEYWSRKHSVSNKLRGYQAMMNKLLGVRTQGGIINGIYVGKYALNPDSTATKFDRYIFDFTSEHIDEALRNQKEWIGVEQYWREKGYWPQVANDQCSNCDFRTICTASPLFRSSVIETDYDKGEPRRFFEI